MQNQIVTKNLKNQSLPLKPSSKRKLSLSLFDETDLLVTEFKRNSIKYGIKVYAVQAAAKKLIYQIKILRNTNEDRFGKYIFLKCEDGIFSWLYEDWLKTLTMRIIWFKRLQREMNAELFDSWMLTKNYRALEGAVEAIAKAYSDGVQKPMDVVKYDLLNLLAVSIIKFENLENDLDKEIKRGSEIAQEANTKLNTVKVVKKGWAKLPRRMEDSLIIDVIKNRYELRYSKVKEEQVELRTQQAENRISQEIQRYNKLLSTEQFASSCTRDTYFNEIANLRLRINQFHKRYDREYARLENNTSYLKLNIEKIALNFAYLIEQLEWYKHRIETQDEPDDSRNVSVSRRSAKTLHFRLSSRTHTPLWLTARSSSMMAKKINIKRTRARKEYRDSSKTQDENVDNQEEITKPEIQN